MVQLHNTLKCYLEFFNQCYSIDQNWHIDITQNLCIGFMIILFWFHDYNLKMASWQKNEEVYSALPNDPSVSYSYCLSSNNCRRFDIEKKNKQNKCDISTLHFKIATPLHIYLKIFSLALQEFGFQNLVQQKRLIHNKICYIILTWTKARPIPTPPMMKTLSLTKVSNFVKHPWKKIIIRETMIFFPQPHFHNNILFYFPSHWLKFANLIML